MSRRLLNFRVSICLACCIFAQLPATLAQQKKAAQRLSVGNFGCNEPQQPYLLTGKLNSRMIDWNQSPTEEQKVLQFLASNTQIVKQGMTVEDMARSMKSFIPTHLDRMELDLLGVDPDTPIGVAVRGRVSTQLIMALEELELTIHFRHGVLTITSQDDAESDPVIQVYEIAESRADSSYDFDNLLNNIAMHVDPDSWLTNGGIGSMTIFERTDRWLLVVSAPFTRQLRIAAFLEQLLPMKVQAGPRNAIPKPTLPFGGWSASPPTSAMQSGGFFRNKLARPSRDLPRGYLKLKK
ncbi:MAG: hypothetical protein AAF483_25480 [Planctomycetota bacterium]